MSFWKLYEWIDFYYWIDVYSLGLMYLFELFSTSLQTYRRCLQPPVPTCMTREMTDVFRMPERDVSNWIQLRTGEICAIETRKEGVRKA
jgi:hypothetical protein